MWKLRTQAPLVALALVSGGFALTLAAAPTATALPQSSKVALIDDASGPNGGTLPTSPHVAVGANDWTGWKDAGFTPTFTNVAPADIESAASDPLAGFDTAVVYQICNIGTYLADQTFNSRVQSFVAGGGKLIFWDSECQGTDYSAFVFPFTTNNPGAMGARGSLAINENSSLGSNVTASPYFLSASQIADNTDAVGDANVMTTYDGNWCTAKQATNYYGVTGPVNTYATYGKGLVIYIGLDADYLFDGMKIDNPDTTNYQDGAANLAYLWELTLRQAWNPVSGLPCSQSASGITLSPATATNQVGTSHTVTATLLDAKQQPISGVVVTFRITEGPQSPMTGTATTGADGKATFTYTGTKAGIDKIQAEATFAQTDAAPVPRTSNVVTKEWTSTIVSPPSGVRPDAWIRLAPAGYIGNDIYNKTARHQTVKSTAVRGEVQNFSVRIYNDGKTRGTFTAKAINSTGGVKVRYFSGGKDVTAAMKSAKGLTFSRAANHFKQFRVQVTIAKNATIGAREFAKVMATSTTGVIRRDAVKAAITVTAAPVVLPSTGAR